MTLELQNGSGAQTLDIKQPEWQRQGYGVVGDVGTPGSGPCAVTVNGSGTLGAGGGALSVAAGDALVGGTVVSVSSTTVDISTGSSSPRKDVLWVDQNGVLTVTEGTPTPHKPDGFTGFETYYPAVPFPATTPATVLAAIWVPANASNLTDTTTNVQDRRMAADHVANEMVSQAVSTEELNSDILQGESESVQSAVNRASTGDKVALRSGNHGPLSISTDNVSVVGSGRGTLIDGGSGDAITVEANGVRVSHLAAQTPPGGGNAIDCPNNYGRSEISHVWIEGSGGIGVNIGANDSRFSSIYCDSANIDAEDIILNGLAENNIVGLVIGSVTDNGTNNTTPPDN